MAPRSLGDVAGLYLMPVARTQVKMKQTEPRLLIKPCHDRCIEKELRDLSLLEFPTEKIRELLGAKR